MFGFIRRRRRIGLGSGFPRGEESGMRGTGPQNRPRLAAVGTDANLRLHDHQGAFAPGGIILVRMRRAV